MRLRTITGLVVGVLFSVAGHVPDVHATPWIEADDPFLRASIEQLADAGYLQGHRSTYPLMWSGIARDLSEIDVSALSEEHQFAFYRVRAALEFSQRPSTRVLRATLSSESDPEDIHQNTFADTLHERGAFTSGSSFTGNHWAGRFQTTFRANPADDKRYNFVGSYLATTIGNWAVSADQMPVWWGPAHENALVLSTNSLPIQALRLNRLSDEPIPGLGWLGHLHTTGFVGRTQSSASLGDNSVAGVRVSARPLRGIELGASYIGHWESLGDFYNQMAGLDARISLLRGVSLYGEVASNNSEDDDLAYTIGADARFSARADRIWQLYVEYSDVPALFYDRSAMMGDIIEEDGYRRWGYSLGAGQDQDMSALSLGVQSQNSNGQGWSVKIRRAEYGPTNFPVAMRFARVEMDKVETYQADVRYYVPVQDSLLTFGLGYRYDDVSAGAYSEPGRSERANEFSFNLGWEFRF